MTGLPLNDPRRPLTDKQCTVLAYLCDNIERGPITSKEIGDATGVRGVPMVLWSLRFCGVITMVRKRGALVVAEVDVAQLEQG